MGVEVNKSAIKSSTKSVNKKLDQNVSNVSEVMIKENGVKGDEGAGVRVQKSESGSEKSAEESSIKSVSKKSEQNVPNIMVKNKVTGVIDDRGVGVRVQKPGTGSKKSFVQNVSRKQSQMELEILKIGGGDQELNRGGQDQRAGGRDGGGSR